MADLERTTWLGDPAWMYRAGDTEVVVLPARGGKLASIRHGGREWLTQPRRPLLPLDALPPTLVAGDMFGWDECAPTIDDCVVLGQHLPLHGDAWDRPWTDAGDGWLAIRGRYLRYELRRWLSVRADGLRLDYVASAPERMPFLWAAHPQFAATPESRVVLGDGSAPLVDIFGRGFWGEAISGPIRHDSIPPGKSGKLFVDPNVPTDRARLIHADGAELQFRWDATVAPWLGVWMDRAGIGPVDAIAIEPMTGYADALATAVSNGRVLWLEPGVPVRWWLDLCFV